ncbi:Aldo/keto reductase [Trichodelitschia bisporula]|uniref:Aldo/keto reductase n=1 Tax=Trichodelitschia bisporula TaxID=703511 RepID=A0A6G1I7W1_9PEZI|nr:Aldo/keto reductase [Trichodelitschia bisporula]
MASLTINSTYRLNSGYEIPVLGFGVYQTPPEQTEEVVLQALQAGYRQIDSAIYYQNEAGAAAGMRRSGIPRDQIFFTTKISPTITTYEGTVKAVDESLAKTGLDYIDLFLIHAPFGGKTGRLAVWRALSEAVQAGKIRSIGVSNFNVKDMEEIEAYIKEREAEKPGSGVPLSVNQVELHPWLTRPEIVKWSQDHGVLLQAYSPLMQGNRAQDPVLQEVAKKYNKSWAQILIRWSLQKGWSPLPKSVTKSRIEDNANVFDFELAPEDVEKLTTDEYITTSAWDPTIHD